MQDAVNALSEYVWEQGSSPVYLGPVSDRFCFLTLVKGDFAGGGEQVKVFQEDGVWKLGGTSQQSGIGGRARCVPLTFVLWTYRYTSEFSWHQAQGNNTTVQMVPDDGYHTCVLTRVQGKFEGDGEHVEITRSGGFWRLGGSSQQSGVGAGARCIDAAPLVAATLQRTCQSKTCVFPFVCAPATCSNAPLDLTERTDLACGLGKMGGKFEGGAEHVQVSMDGGRWWLDAAGRQTSTYKTSAYCMF